MSDASDALLPISFTFEYEGSGWARASISDGATSYEMDPSYVPEDPLFGLLQAVVEILRSGYDTGCEWWYEPALDRWGLHREGDRLRITIRYHRDGFPTASVLTPSWFWSSEAGELRFGTTCDVWAFAAQVHRAVRRLAPIGDDDPTWLRRRAEYRALSEFLEERKHVGRLPSGTKPT